MQALQFRHFRLDDLPVCVELFTSNLNGYFSPDEIDDFRRFLTALSAQDHYYVGLLDGQIVACGGWDKQPKGYFLRWGIIDHRHHHLGLGSQMLQFRMAQIRELFGDVDLYIKTSAKAHGFYKKYGFQVVQVVKDGIYPGIDEYQMQRSAGATPKGR